MFDLPVLVLPEHDLEAAGLGDEDGPAHVQEGVGEGVDAAPPVVALNPVVARLKVALERWKETVMRKLGMTGQSD